MLHELLLALSGYPGSIFTENESKDIQVVCDLPFIHPTEAALLNRLCKLATYFKNFEDFIKKYGHAPTTLYKHTEDKTVLHGLYIRSFCIGLDKVLDPYRQDLLKLERDILADPHLPASHVQCALEEYHLLFPGIYNIVDEIKTHNIHGCYILEILHKHAANGIPGVKQAVLKILHHCHGLLYKQLTAWLLHGLLMDEYGEFFIHRVKGRLLTNQETVEEDELGLAGVTGRQLKQMMQISNVPVDSTVSGYEQYALNSKMLPSYIPTRVADRILFIGESVQMFECDQKPTVKRAGSVLKNNEEVFAKKLHVLSQQDEFSLLDFEKTIDEIRIYVAEHLWSLIVQETRLEDHLRVVKDFYLLGRGELFLTFIDQAQSVMRVPPTGTTQHDVNMAFQQAARSVLLDDDLVQKFQLTVEAKRTGKVRKNVGQESHQPPEVGWNSLGMNYTVQWPLHVLFTQSCLEKYNTIFKFLLAVKRTQQELHHIWGLQMERKHLHAEDVHSAEKWHLRTHMAFLVDNLQYYLQVDMIESQYSILIEVIHRTKDFEAVRYAHDQFLTSLLSQSFLLMKPVSRCLHEILDICHSFCTLITNAGVPMSEREMERLQTLTKSFQNQSNLLFKILSSVRSHQSSPHLAQLLLRIDYNRYFTHAGGQLGSFRTNGDNTAFGGSTSSSY